MNFYTFRHGYRFHAVESAVSKTIQQSALTSAIVALSGGADSTALLRAFADSGIAIEAAHCNFHLRGDESDRDAEFCRDLCARLGIRLNYIDFDVNEFRRLNPGSSVEMACRKLRYDWFHSVLEGHTDSCSCRIAVAHNSDDNAETLFLNLLRGSGLKGLKGMETDNGKIIRPLLSVSRHDIIGYLDSLGQEYVTDSTNLSSDYQRNFLRNDIFPMLRERWPGFDKAIARSLSNLRRENRILDAAIECALKENRKFSDASMNSATPHLSLETIRNFPDPVTLIYRWGADSGLTPEMAVEIAGSIRRCDRPGAIWNLENMILRLERDGLHIFPAETESDISFSGRFERESVTMTPELMTEIRSDRSNMTAWLPGTPQDYIIRRPAKGDRIEPLGMKGSSLLSDIMKDAGLTLGQRRDTAVVTDQSGRILWVEGLKRSRHALVDPASATVTFIRRKK